MLTYLLNNYPALYFILSLGLIISGSALLFTAPVHAKHKSPVTARYAVSDIVFMQFVISAGLLDELYRPLSVLDKIAWIHCDYSTLFEVETQPNLTDLKTLKKSYNKNQETIIVVTNNPPPPSSTDTTEYMDVGDIIRMKMNLLSCA